MLCPPRLTVYCRTEAPITTAKTLLTAEDHENLPDDGKRYELLDGELREAPVPNPEHAWITTRIIVPLDIYVRPRGLGHVLAAPSILLRRRPDRVRTPDIGFFAAGRFPGDRPPARGYPALVPDLLVEIVSANDRAAYVEQKIEEWLAVGARLVWAVYPVSRSVVDYRGRTEVRVYQEGERLDGGPVFPDFSLPVGEIFA